MLWYDAQFHLHVNDQDCTPESTIPVRRSTMEKWSCEARYQGLMLNSNSVRRSSRQSVAQQFFLVWCQWVIFSFIEGSGSHDIEEDHHLRWRNTLEENLETLQMWHDMSHVYPFLHIYTRLRYPSCKKKIGISLAIYLNFPFLLFSWSIVHQRLLDTLSPAYLFYLLCTIIASIGW